MKSIMTILLYAIMIVSCESLEFSVEDTHSEPIKVLLVDYPVVPVDHPAIACMVKKAHQIADIKWKPLRPIPSLSDEWLPEGNEMWGIPYSSVKEKDKFVGQEVSFYTFMSAVHNPRSVLYTEDVKNPPYCGTNCGVYYGTVCSMAINYALGIERPIESKMYVDLPYIAKVLQQDPSSVYPGDVLWSEGHVVLVLEIEREKNGAPISFTILESAGNTRIKKLPLSTFIERWDKDGWIAYRDLKLADNLHYEPIPFVINPGDPVMDYSYNSDLCTSRGDRVTFLQGEDVIVNIFNASYDTIELYRGDTLISSIAINTNMDDYVFTNLSGGKYSVRLCSQSVVSDFVLFEIVDEQTIVSQGDLNYVVSFCSNSAVPEYIVICSRDGNRDAIIDITEAELKLGQKTITGDYSGKYLKVFYKGLYGRVSNNPIQL